MSQETPSEEISADDLRRMVRALGLVTVPEHLMARVLESVRSHRASIRRFDESGLDVADVVTAQPYRV
ncbi:MAG TPA: hypothetical protein VGM69_01135 [Chloroflexota bacterium]